MGRPRKNPHAAPTVLPKKIGQLPGFFDINTSTDPYWEALLKRFSKTARVYGFSRVETPLLEDSRLFQAYYGNPDVPLDSLLSFEHGALALGLRPSQLPGILRNFHQQKLHENPNIYKWHYSGFVASKDLDGRLLPDFEYGCEILGSFNHLNEAQVIASAWEFLNSLGLEDLVLEINNLGSLECQENYSRALVDALSPKKYELCDECNEKLATKALLVFACQNLDCQSVLAEAPTVLDFLDQDSHKGFTSVLEALDEMNIPYQLNAFYVGKSVCERTNFTVKYKNKDQMLSLAQGGHHLSQAQNISGKQFGAFGFYGSMNRLKNLMEENSIEATRQVLSEVCLVPLGELAAKRSLRLFRDLTAEKIMVYDHFGLSGVKNQLKVAQENKVPIALIMGQKEAMDEMVILRDVKSGMQEIISYDKIVDEVKKRLGK